MRFFAGLPGSQSNVSKDFKADEEPGAARGALAHAAGGRARRHHGKRRWLRYTVRKHPFLRGEYEVRDLHGKRVATVREHPFLRGEYEVRDALGRRTARLRPDAFQPDTWRPGGRVTKGSAGGGIVGTKVACGTPAYQPADPDAGAMLFRKGPASNCPTARLFSGGRPARSIRHRASSSGDPAGSEAGGGESRHMRLDGVDASGGLPAQITCAPGMGAPRRARTVPSRGHLAGPAPGGS